MSGDWATFICIDETNADYPYLVCCENGTGYQAVKENEIMKE